MSTLIRASKKLKHLEETHRKLDAKITRHWEKHDSDDKIRREKFEKLALKREIEELKKEIGAMEGYNG